MNKSVISLSLLVACSGPQPQDDTGVPPVPPAAGCPEVVEGGEAVCVSIDTQIASDIAPSFSGFNHQNFNDGLQPWDERLVEMARTLVPGHLRFPGGGSTYGYDWSTGGVPEATLDDYANGVNDKKYGKFLGYQETIAGKGFLKLTDFARFAQAVGARIVMVINTRTNGGTHEASTPESAGALADLVIERGYDVAVWELDTEPVYWSSAGGSQPQRYDGGYNYVEEMKPYFDAINDAYERAGIAEADRPSINISTSDGGENENHALFDGVDYESVGEDCPPIAGGELGVSGFGSDDDPESTHSKYWTGWSHHWYTGHNSYFDDAGNTIDDEQDTGDLPDEADRFWEIFHEDVNYRVTQSALDLIDCYFLPVNGLGGLNDSPASTLRGSITEYNLRFKVDFTDSAFSAVHAAESVLRWSTHPSLALVGYHALTAEAIDQRCDHGDTASSRASNNRVQDSQDNDYDFFWDLPGLALQLVNTAVNTADSRLQTTLEGGVEVRATEVLYSRNEVTEKWGWNQADTSSQVSALYGQTYRGRDGIDRLVLTNRSGTSHTVHLEVDGKLAEDILKTYSIHPPDPYDPLFANDGEAVDCEEDLTSDVLDQAVEEGVVEEGMFTLPPWSVVLVEIPTTPHSSAPERPEPPILTPGVERLEVEWEPVADATSYRVKWGVTAGVYPFSVSVNTTEHTIEPYADGIDLFVVVSAENGSGEGENSDVASAQTLPEYRVEDEFSVVSDLANSSDWFSGCGGTTTWTSNGTTLQAGFSSNLKQCLLHESSGPESTAPQDPGFDYELAADYQKVSATLQIPEWTDGTSGQRVGVVGRYQGVDAYVAAYLDHDNDDLRLVVLSPSLASGSETIAHSDDLGLDALEGSWLELELELDGQTIRVWFDDGTGSRLIAAALDLNYDTSSSSVALTRPGKAGIFVRRQETHFERLLVR